MLKGAKHGLKISDLGTTLSPVQIKEPYNKLGMLLVGFHPA